MGRDGPSLSRFALTGSVGPHRAPRGQRRRTTGHTVATLALAGGRTLTEVQNLPGHA